MIQALPTHPELANAGKESEAEPTVLGGLGAQAGPLITLGSSIDGPLL